MPPKRGQSYKLKFHSLSQLAWASSYAWALAGGTIFAENGARGKPKRGFGGPESSWGESRAQKGQKCLKNDLCGLKMSRNGVGTAKNDIKTTKCAKNAKLWSGKGKSESQRGLKVDPKPQIDAVGRGCILGGIWIGKARRPSRRGGTSAGAAYKRSGGKKSVKTGRKRPKMAFWGVLGALEGLKSVPIFKNRKISSRKGRGGRKGASGEVRLLGGLGALGERTRAENGILEDL